MKRKEREFNKLKERLTQLLSDKREKKPGWLESSSCRVLPVSLWTLQALLISNFQPLTSCCQLLMYWTALEELMGREAFGKLTRLKQSQHTARYSWLTPPLNKTFTFPHESSFYVQLNWINVHISVFPLVPRHEGQLFKTLLGDYEARQRELLLENAELHKVLQQMRGEMTSILGSNKPARAGDDDVTQVRGRWGQVKPQFPVSAGSLWVSEGRSVSARCPGPGQVWGGRRRVWLQ